jgi:hypothetical protein
MTRHELNTKIGETLGKLHWAKVHGRMLALGTHKAEDLFGLAYDVPALLQELKELLRQQKNREFTEEINAFGSVVHRWSRHGSGRYHWDFGPCSSKYDWKQYDTDQDASYFGVWVHVEKRLILTYCEGDVSLVIAPDVEAMRKELASMAEFYGPPPPAFICCTGIESRNGGIAPTGVTDLIYDERPTV